MKWNNFKYIPSLGSWKYMVKSLSFWLQDISALTLFVNCVQKRLHKIFLYAGYTVLWYHLEGGWTSCQDFFHLQAGIWELCILHASAAGKPPLHFCMQFTKAINSAILMFSYTLRWNVSCLPCVTVPGGRGPTLPKAGGPRLLKELYFTWMMKAYLLPQSSSGTTTQVTFAGMVNSWRTSSEASLNTTVTTYDNTRMTLENSSGIVGGSQVTFTTPPLLLETLLISSAEIFVSSSGSNASA